LVLICSDPNSFPFEPIEYNDHCINILQKVNSCIKQYLEGVIETPLDKNYVNIQDIVTENDNSNLLKLVFDSCKI